MRLRLLILLLGALLVSACSSGGGSTTGPTSTLTVPGQTAAPTTVVTVTVSPTPDVSTPLGAALASDEEMAATQITAKNLYYAYKVGQHVTVLRRDVTAGTELVVLEYNEPHEAKLGSGNYWEELNPSVALDPGIEMLIYAADPDVISYDLATGTSTHLLQQVPGTTGQVRLGWVTPTGIEVCCAYALASMSLGPTGRAVVQMKQDAGSTLASFATDGTAACQLTDPAGIFFSGAVASWNTSGDAVVANAGGLSNPGVFLASAEDRCEAQALTTDSSSYQDATWSPDGQSIAVAKRTGQRASAIVVMGKDGSSTETIVDDGAINFAPLYSADGSLVYYARAASTNEDGSVAKWGIGVAETASPTPAEVLTLPTGWTARPMGFTAEGYLILQMTFGCEGIPSCGSRLAIVDVTTGDPVYVSAMRDFTNFLGLVP